jgi:hypothetical protein
VKLAFGRVAMTVGCLLGAGIQPCIAQGWSADLYAGGTSYDALAGRVAAANLIGNLRYQRSAATLGYLSLAAPLDASAVLWSAGGVSGRLGGTRPGRNLPLWGEAQATVGAGLELGAHGYAYHDADADFSGGGVTLHGLPFLRASLARFALEARAGRHQHLFSATDTSGRHGLYELGLRGAVTSDAHWAQADLRWLRGSGASFPYVGVQASTSRSSGRVWGWVGKWMGAELDGAEWGLGGSVTVGRVGELWASVRQDGGDPLVESGERRAWNLGFSRRLGRPRVLAAELAPRIAGGSARFTLPESEVSGTGTPSVAGEFSGWRPTPMRREGSEWVLDVPLASGVYRFAFVRASGEWFVPEGYPGRLDDGMGGHVAVMVVP